MNIKEILKKHQKWLDGKIGGERAVLRDVDLSRANLKGANLRNAYLFNVNLWCANLCNADLSDASLWNSNLRGAYLLGANLRNADLRNVNLREANLIKASLYNADLRGADLCGADLWQAKNLDKLEWSLYTGFYPLQCPEEGEYIAWKKANGKIVKLKITEKAKRSSATSRKCRASEALVLDIQSIDGTEHFDSVSSNRDKDFIYRVGEIVRVNNFDEDRWNECSTGIHHFITREEAVKYKEIIPTEKEK